MLCEARGALGNLVAVGIDCGCGGLFFDTRLLVCVRGRGGLALLLLASVLVRAYARDVWNRAIDRLPAPLAAALDAAASLGRGRRGFERASRTDDADEFDPFDSPPLAGNLKPPRPV